MLIAGCGGGGDGMQLTDASSSSDAATYTGLLVTWAADPTLPGTVKTDISVTSATFRFSRVQVLGDAGNSEITTRYDFEANWTPFGQEPQAIIFSGAPTGLYSQVKLDLDGAQLASSYEITGTAKVGANTEPFRIRDTEAIEIDINDYAVQLIPGRDALIEIELDLGDVLDLNYGQFVMENGERILDETGPQINDVRGRLENAFTRP